MSGKDKFIMICGLIVMVTAMAGGYFLLGPINQQRKDMKLTLNPDVQANKSTKVVAAQMLLGSFRGLAVDILWQRANTLKQQGKFYEMQQLAQFITDLQPTFDKVYDYQAWNLAYNISVATHTPEERWYWVEEGINLLRKKGIPNNPTTVPLYKSLSWIFLHKVGQFSDDMHKYYKAKLAMRWQFILDVPPVGSTQVVLNAFKPIADLHQSLASDFDANQPYLLRRYGQVQEDRFIKQYPDAAPLIKQLAGMGHELDAVFLELIGDLKMREEAMSMGMIPANTKLTGNQREATLLKWMNENLETEAGKQLLLYIRAKSLVNDFHMNPSFMMDLMEGQWLKLPSDELVRSMGIENPDQPMQLPLDWRHPGSHGLYWAALGVKASQVRREETNKYYMQTLNTDRQVLHALQAMMHTGTISFDPILGYYDQLPDARYIDAYERTIYSSQARIGGKYETSAAPESFKTGHENFLMWSVQLAYFNGSREQADHLYTRLGKLYGLKRDGRIKYHEPLDQYMLASISDELEDMDGARRLISGLFRQALSRGYAENRADIARQYYSFAKACYTKYQKEFYTRHVAMTEARMGLKPFDDLAADAFGRLILSPPNVFPLTLKMRVWENYTNDEYLESLKRRSYDRIRVPLKGICDRMNWDMSLMFPEPKGMAEYRKAEQAKNKALQESIK